MRVEINIELAPKGNLIANIKRVPASFRQRTSLLMALLNRVSSFISLTRSCYEEKC